MKRIAAGLIILAVLAACAFTETFLTGKYVDETVEIIEKSLEHCDAGDLPGAQNAAALAFDTWQSHRSFNDIFIRHAETDSTYEAFCQLIGALQSDGSGEITAAYSQLLGHLDCIKRMEMPGIGSIF